MTLLWLQPAVGGLVMTGCLHFERNREVLMLATPQLERTARDIYEQEWDRLQRVADTRLDDEPSPLQVCPGPWLLRDLLQLVADSHDQPIDELEPRIRRLILERNFIDENGDPCQDLLRRRAIDLHVTLLVRVMHRVRDVAMQEQGEWSNVPAAPQMFG
jgi:hypothetical protein